MAASTGVTAVSGVKRCAIGQTSETSGALDSDAKGAESGGLAAISDSDLPAPRCCPPHLDGHRTIARRHYLHMLDDISVGAKHRDNTMPTRHTTD